MEGKDEKNGEIRAFIALEIDNAGVLKKISDIQAKFKRIKGKIKFVELENIHVTLKFLGSITVETAREVYKIVEDLDTLPDGGVDVEISEVGTFKKSRPRVLWCKLHDPGEIIRDTYRAIDERLHERLHIPKENKKFKAHVTLARIRHLDDRDAFIRLLEENKEIVLGTQHVSTIKFKKSVLTSKGPIYSDLVF
ncbi:MAG: RNA 2',3'-cyclic phosphodiesterase [Promethearchaeota archaeon]